MDIEQIQQKRRETERKINHLLVDFARETGLEVRAVEFQCAFISPGMGREPVYVTLDARIP